MTMTLETLPTTYDKKAYRSRKIRKIHMSFYLTPVALEYLRTLAEADGLSDGSELEVIIRDRYNRRKHKLQKDERDSESD